MIGIVGLGLVGGSLALDLRSQGREVLGFDPDPQTRSMATDAGITIVGSLDEMAERAELVAVAAPPAEVGPALIDLRRSRTDLVLTDVASVKARASLGVDAAVLGDSWVGGHPMAGTERTGFSAARRGLLSGATWMLTPHDEVDRMAFLAVLALVHSVGAVPVVVDPEEHDRLVAAVSHVTHLMSFGLNEVAHRLGPAVVDLVAGPSFRDATRVAASDPAFWAEVTDRNRDAVTEVLRDIRDWIEMALDDDTPALEARLRAARRVPTPRSDESAKIPLDAPDAIARLRQLGHDGYAISEIDGAGGSAELVLHRR